MLTTHRSARRLTTAAVLVVSLAGTTGARGQDISLLEQQTSALEGEMARTEQAYNREFDLGNSEGFEDRLSKGELFFVSPDMYEQAATVLYGVVLPQNSGRVGYDDALYMLAESLYQLGNLGIARKYFSELLGRPGHDKHTLAISTPSRSSSRVATSAPSTSSPPSRWATATTCARNTSSEPCRRGPTSSKRPW
jgi:hypothetical protein